MWVCHLFKRLSFNIIYFIELAMNIERLLLLFSISILWNILAFRRKKFNGNQLRAMLQCNFAFDVTKRLNKAFINFIDRQTLSHSRPHSHLAPQKVFSILIFALVSLKPAQICGK